MAEFFDYVHRVRYPRRSQSYVHPTNVEEVEQARAFARADNFIKQVWQLSEADWVFSYTVIKDFVIVINILRIKRIGS